MVDRLVRLIRDDDGQDLVEYAMLAGFFGLVALAGFTSLQNALASAYGRWDTGTQNLWTPPDPGAGGS
jgi:Flp pilus assembly pilin Flp